MRTTKTISVSLPPEMLKEAEQVAKQEGRTKSELVREALRCYVNDRKWREQWEELRAYGAAKAKELGIKEGDVDRLIHEYRAEQRKRGKEKVKSHG